MPPNFVVGKPLEVHPMLGEQTQARDFWRRSDRARWDYAVGVDAQGQPLLPKHEREPADRYSRRRQQAIVRRYAKPILDRYNDFVARGGVDRKEATSGPYAVLLNDADGAGTDMDRFMSTTRRHAQVDGLSYVLVDANDPNVYANVAQENQAKKRGILRRIDPNDVIWWRDWQGSVIEAVVLCMSKDGGRFGWYVTETTTQRVLLKLNEDGKQWVVASVEAEQKHTYGGCPLVRLYPDLSDEGSCPGEDSQCAPLAEGQKRICNIDSWLFEELQGCTFTTTAFLGVSADQVKEAIGGPGHAVCLPNSGGSNPSIAKIGSDVAQAASIRDSLAYEIRELYRVAGLSPGNPTEAAQPESGVAKAFAFNEIEAKCSALADATERTENRCVLLLSKGFGWAYPGDADYPDKFDAPDLAKELGICIQMQTAGLPDVLKRAQVMRIATAGFELTGDEKAELTSQLDEAKANEEAAKQSEIVNPAKPGEKSGDAGGFPAKAPASAPAPTPAPSEGSKQPKTNGAAVSSTALNGAQVTSLADVISKVSLGQMPAIAAELLLIEAFPAMDPVAIKKMVAASAAFTPEPLPENQPAS